MCKQMFLFLLSKGQTEQSAQTELWRDTQSAGRGTIVFGWLLRWLHKVEKFPGVERVLWLLLVMVLTSICAAQLLPNFKPI